MPACSAYLLSANPVRLVSSLAALLLLASCASTKSPYELMIEQQRQTEALARAYFDAWNRGDTATLDSLVAAGFVRGLGGVPSVEGRDSLHAHLASLREQRPAFYLDVRQVVASVDRAAVHWEASYVSSEPRTRDRRIAWDGMSLLRVADRQVVEEWVVEDLLGMHRQRGYELVLPPLEPPARPRVVEEAPPPDLLYEKTEQELRQSFSDALYSQYRVEVKPEAPRKVDLLQINAWLDRFGQANPRVAAFARQALGDVLSQEATIGFVIPRVVDSSCSRMDAVLFIAVPDRLQNAQRPFDGYIVKDECDLGEGPLCRHCFGGTGKTGKGVACSCVCTTGACPRVDCVSC